MQYKKLICLDIEATGLNTKLDKIIEVAIAQFSLEDKAIHATFETLINPKCKISKESQRIHRITDAMVEGKPEFRTVIPKLKEFVKDSTIIGHGINWDLEFLINSAKEHHIKLFDKKPRSSSIHFGWHAYMDKALSILLTTYGNILTFLALDTLIVQ